jgi:hypothetical protein
MQNLRKLLIGTWKSDKRLTLEGCHRYHRLTGAKKRTFGSLFGRLILRYTPSRLHHALRGTEWTAKYNVVAADSDSVVLRVHSDDLWRKALPITADIVKQMAKPPPSTSSLQASQRSSVLLDRLRDVLRMVSTIGHPTIRLQATPGSRRRFKKKVFGSACLSRTLDTNHVSFKEGDLFVMVLKVDGRTIPIL